MLELDSTKIIAEYLKSWLKTGEEVDEESLYYIASSLERGTPCISWEKGVLRPRKSRTSTGFLLENLKALPSSLSSINEKAPLVPFKNRLYFQKYWVLEKEIKAQLARLRSVALPKVSVYKGTLPLNQEQTQAVEMAAQSSLFVLCGGPGSGKTHTAAVIAQVLITQFSDSCQLALTAPTGKAALRLGESLSRNSFLIPYLEKFPPVTLHALIKKAEGDTLAADVILIDESSMIDCRILAELLKRIKTGARVVFLGDPHQLGPVEHGVAFSPLIRSMKKGKEIAYLKECVRIETPSLLRLANGVRDGDVYCVENELKSSQSIYCKSLENCDYAFFQKFSRKFHEKESFALLSASKKGEFGVKVLNKKILDIVLAEGGDIVDLPIIVTRNNYNLELFNGELGILRYQNKAQRENFIEEGDQLLFEKQGKIRKLPALLLPQIDLAFCLSIHKAQGSEFDHIAIFLNKEGADNALDRKAVYTAITRAKKRISILGNRETLLSCVRNELSSTVEINL